MEDRSVAEAAALYTRWMQRESAPERGQRAAIRAAAIVIDYVRHHFGADDVIYLDDQQVLTDAYYADCVRVLGTWRSTGEDWMVAAAFYGELALLRRHVAALGWLAPAPTIGPPAWMLSADEQLEAGRLVIGPDRLICYADRRAAELLRFPSRSELFGASLLDLSAPWERSRVRRELEGVQRAKPTTPAVYTARLGDGALVPMKRLTARRLTDVGVLSHFRLVE